MERLALDRFSSPWLRNQHLARYRWAAGFATGLRVLDAASGTGDGARILGHAGWCGGGGAPRRWGGRGGGGGGGGGVPPAPAGAGPRPAAALSISTSAS